ncbi:MULTISPECIES: hypothetical protein [Psychrobacter]|uniref:hypothetical protein n=1 Tax=Psychrobacter TaxID=497 RepID=UPI0008A6BB4B|nr:MULTISPECIES: hypothetical protein [Psychrobacter]AOY42537.1 hypothetical protein AOT82_158 [Psychrobacter sp. AntiMn-1]
MLNTIADSLTQKGAHKKQSQQALIDISSISRLVGYSINHSMSGDARETQMASLI